MRETLLLVVVGELTHQEVADLLENSVGDRPVAGQPWPGAAARFWLTERGSARVDHPLMVAGSEKRVAGLKIRLG